jgi:hypothetical protein
MKTLPEDIMIGPAALLHKDQAQSSGSSSIPALLAERV